MPSEKEKDVTIYDLARELNLSAATISRGLQDNPAVNEKTRQRIQALAELRGFRINNFARNLRQNKTHTIGVMMHEINTSFMVSVLAGIEEAIAKSDYNILVAHSAEHVQTEIINAKNLFNRRVDGIIASLSLETSNLDHFEGFFRKGIPVVFFDRVEEQNPGAKVIIDNYACGYQITSHLISQGCTSIVHLTNSLNRNVYKRRFDGYVAALGDAGIGFKEENLIVCGMNKAEAEKAAHTILNMNPRPDGLFVSGDLAAAICIKVFQKNGLKVPHDIAVAGFNNDIISTIIEPNLTTVNYSGITMGNLAGKLLLDHFTGVQDIGLTNTVIMNAELIVRESSKRSP
ncbi:MAG TPA: LacI family DNA-binding transcriptional regulator [Phnomibacter sp.]|nr:LacI family DNA-binding transcriptional regulator [Phnomibacter sp.]